MGVRIALDVDPCIPAVVQVWHGRLGQLADDMPQRFRPIGAAGQSRLVLAHLYVGATAFRKYLRDGQNFGYATESPSTLRDEAGHVAGP